MKVTYTELDYHEVDELIKANFPLAAAKDYECVAFQEWDNDSCYTFRVRPEAPDQWSQKELDAGKFQWQLAAMLDKLCLDGKIEAGNYLVRVSW